MANSWYAIRTKPHKESLVYKQAQLRGFTVFYPQIRAKPVNPRAKKIKPFFPGYLFVNVDLQKTGLSTFKYMPYTVGLVCFGGEPAYIPDSFIYEMQRRLEDLENEEEKIIDLEKGDRVQIEDGLFEGYHAIFDSCISGRERVRVLLTMLNDRHIPIELNAALISKASA